VRAGRRAALALCVPVALGLCLALSQVAEAGAASYTWAGRSKTTAEWSFASNWEGGAPTESTEIESLRFPRLTSTACTVEQATHRCYLSFNDVGGLSAQSLTLDDGDRYVIRGEPLILGAGGLHASPETGSSGPAGDIIEMPFQLSAPQRWEIADRGAGLREENGLFLGAKVTGPGNALTVELSNGPALVLDNKTEVGPVTIEGPNATGERAANGSVLFGDGELDSSDRQGVDLRHVFFAGTGALGVLTTEGATLEVGSGAEPTEGLEASSVTLDSVGGVLFEVVGSEMTAQTDYSQLVSQGSVQLAGSLVVIVGKPTEAAPCPVLVPGHTYTLISASGKLSGTFANAPEGGPEIPIDFNKECSQLSQTMRIAYNRSGATQTVTGTVEEEALNSKKRGEEAILTAAQEQANRIAEEAAKRKREEEAAAAAARKQQEEAAAKVMVLSVKETSPDATIMGTTLHVSASGAVSIKIRCSVGSNCKGSVTLRTIHAVSAELGGAAKAKPAILTLASGSFTISGGHEKTITLHLSAKARALLSRSHTLRVWARVVVRNSAGTNHTGQTIVTLRAPKAKHGKG
jgi:nucleoid-associated protein YgaU